MEKAFKKLNTEELGFTYDVISGTTDVFGNVISSILTSEGKTLDMIDNVSLNTKYFKLPQDDWKFGMGNNDKLLVSEVGKFINYKIEKSGSSTISNATNIKEFTMIPTRENRDQYRQFIIDSNKNQTPKPDKIADLETMTDFSGYTHFFIYRDPVKRFLSMANFCNNVQSVGQDLNQKFETKRQIIDNYLLLCSLTETNVEPKSGECHFLSQAKHLLNVTKVDFMVNIEDLSAFLLTKLGDKINANDLHKNKTREKTPLHLEVSDLTDADLTTIKSIFADDYTLYETYKNVLWTK